MYTPVVMQNYRAIKKGEQLETLDEARAAARLLSIEAGQMPAVIDDQNLLCWKGGVMPKEKPAPRRAAKAGQ
jgi:hypothetical protein